MQFVKWRHSGRSLLLPIIVLAPLTAPNPNLSLKTTGLLDTGATKSGIRGDLASQLGLAPRGQHPIETANGLMMSTEYLFRVGFVSGDYTDPAFDADRSFPYVFEEPILGFELQPGFKYPMLIGMDIIGANDLTISRNGEASFKLY